LQLKFESVYILLTSLFTYKISYRYPVEIEKVTSKLHCPITTTLIFFAVVMEKQQQCCVNVIAFCFFGA